MSKWDRAIEQICEGVKPTMTSKSVSDYIKREDAIKAIKKDVMGGLNYESILNRLPSADVVEIVRCEDCEHWKCNPNTDKYGACQKVSYDDFEVVMECDDFCSYGERREQEHE